MANLWARIRDAELSSISRRGSNDVQAVHKSGRTGDTYRSALEAEYGMHVLGSLLRAFSGRRSIEIGLTAIAVAGVGKRYATDGDRLAELGHSAKRVALRLALRSSDAG